MSNSTDDIAKSRKRPSQTGEPVLVRLQPDLVAKLDAWRADQRPIPSRPEALRMILKEWLAGR
ncbi:hypothetical protein KHC23_12350 [Ancylobacter dichloromethanicus]|uniref:Ribbon-helix-helix protein CopG domain-containing protein n=1 Tax=Ancylobacter dichloromethanicus TaxID=518825 RepID=A0A9W6J9K8_9HYPH|nr:hypothetical protein [Ancylobacter dichloromethanicus]MBS7554445.1 hypothetical protein [Ancylobacter dichloromethanicus]GLK71573.1 hypothetical protein GCM10017643_16880 [Ancylobacter dichloromethanicus]